MYPFLEEEDIRAALAEADADIAAGRLLSPEEVRRGLGLNED
jgi:predicted transcriptional regulator